MQHLEPVRFHLEERLEAGQFLRRLPARRQRQPRRGAGFDFFLQFLHFPAQLGWKKRRKQEPRWKRRGEGRIFEVTHGARIYDPQQLRIA